jgi:hypothetical protein
MDYHYRFVLPHKSNSKPEKDADKEEKDIVRDKVHTSHSITNKLDHGSQPFYCIDSQHFVCHRFNPCMNSCSGRLTVNLKQYYPSASLNYNAPRGNSDAATSVHAISERQIEYRHSSG